MARAGPNCRNSRKWWLHKYGEKSNVLQIERAISNLFDFLIGIQEVASLWKTQL